jgi:hypothetical protein
MSMLHQRRHHTGRPQDAQGGGRIDGIVGYGVDRFNVEETILRPTV